MSGFWWILVDKGKIFVVVLLKVTLMMVLNEGKLVFFFEFFFNGLAIIYWI